MASEQGPDALTIQLAEGQAALFLAESLVLALIDAGVLSKEQVIEAIELVVATKTALAGEGNGPEVARAAAGILTTMANSIAALPDRRD